METIRFRCTVEEGDCFYTDYKGKTITVQLRTEPDDLEYMYDWRDGTFAGRVVVNNKNISFYRMKPTKAGAAKIRKIISEREAQSA